MSFYSKGEYVILKTWDEIKEKYPVYINDDMYGATEIYIKEDNFYLYEDSKHILGTCIKIKGLLHSTGTPERFFTDNEDGHTISEFMIKRPANNIDEPECFV